MSAQIPPKLIIPLIILGIVWAIVDFLAKLIVKNIEIFSLVFILLITITGMFYYLKKCDEKRQLAILYKKHTDEMIIKMQNNEREEHERREREKVEREEHERREREKVEREEHERREREKVEREKFNAIQVSNIDSMSGIEFENYLKKLLIAMHYNVILTKTSGDFGVDLIASKNNDKIAIQAKRHKMKVSRRAISDAVTGMHHYNCNKAMVITNNYFTRDAIKLAKSTNCTLINRDILINLILKIQRFERS